MTTPKSSKRTSVPRRHKLFALLAPLAAWWLVSMVWPGQGAGVKPEDWHTYGAAVASASASMAGLVLAATALLFGLSNTDFVKYLQTQGALTRLLFDLVVSALLWLLALALGLAGALPGMAHTELVLKAGTAAAGAGMIYFGPVGYTFWLLLRLSGTPAPAAWSHDWDNPDELEFEDPPGVKPPG